MTPITLRVLEGADKGRVFSDIGLPITLGREEGNSIQLNDERVSRYHAKIQEDHNELVLTDLESTNGTKVNGEDTQLRILRFGDMITMGRSTILYGSRQQIDDRWNKFKSESREHSAEPEAVDDMLSQKMADDSHYQLSLLEEDPPQLPQRLSPGQAAQMAEMLEYIHLRLRKLVKRIEVSKNGRVVQVNFNEWQHLLDLQARISEYLREIGHPNET